MNREIKVKVWDKLEKTFIYPNKGYQGHYILSLDGNFYNLQNGSGGDEYEVCQYSGCNDNNNVEIYEGDIVRFDSRDNSYPNERVVVNLVCVYERNNAWFVFNEKLNDEHDGYYWLEIVGKCEVIGNIFENKDLL